MSRHASCKGLSPAMAGLSSPFHSRSKYNVAVLQPRRRVATPSVWALPRSLATTRRIIHLFSLPAGTKMFQFPALASTIGWMTVLQTAGLSHSEISGSMVICTCPELFAAYHVLHSLDEPRHPPCALSYFFRYPYLKETWTLLILSAVLYCLGIHITMYASLSLELCYFTVLACVNMSKIGVMNNV